MQQTIQVIIAHFKMYNLIFLIYLKKNNIYKIIKLNRKFINNNIL